MFLSISGFLAAIAALYVTMSVSRSVGPSVGWSINNEFQSSNFNIVGTKV